MLIGLFDSGLDSSNPVSPTPVVNSLSSFISYGREQERYAPDTPYIFLPAESFDFTYAYSSETDTPLTRRAMPKAVRSSSMAFDATLRASLIPYGMTMILADAIGSVPESIAYATKYRHTLKPQGRYDKSISFDTRYNDVVVVRSSGAQCLSASLSASFGEIVGCEFTFKGGESYEVDSSVSPTFSSVVPFTFKDAYVMIDSNPVANIKSFDLSIAPRLTPVQVIRNTTNPAGYVYGGMDISISTDIDFDISDWSRLENANKVSIGLYLESGLDSFTVEFPNARTASLNASVSPLVDASADFIVTDDNDDFMSIFVVSSESSIR